MREQAQFSADSQTDLPTLVRRAWLEIQRQKALPSRWRDLPGTLDIGRIRRLLGALEGAVAQTDLLSTFEAEMARLRGGKRIYE